MKTELKQYDVVFTYNTAATNAGSALKLALAVIATGNGFYVEVDEEGKRVFDGDISDITIEEVKHED
jgi:hypothetical protein